MKAPLEALHPKGKIPLLLLVGNFASGKSSVARQLKRRMGCQVLEMGDVVRKSASAVGEPAFRHAEHILTSSQPLTFAYKAAENIKFLRGPAVVVGIRTPGELAMIQRIRSSVIIGLDASPVIRRMRWRQRQAIDSDNFEYTWHERDAAERSWGVDEVIHAAHRVVDANGPLSVVVDEVEHVWISLSAITI
jgi:dephospho-CoA kinase